MASKIELIACNSMTQAKNDNSKDLIDARSESITNMTKLEEPSTTDIMKIIQNYGNEIGTLKQEMQKMKSERLTRKRTSSAPNRKGLKK